MGNDIVKEIEALNKKIDKLMNDKTKADAQKDFCVSRLNDALKAYEKDYGVVLKGSNLKETRANLEKEIKSIQEKTEEDFNKANELIKLIEKGDLDEAWNMLGLVNPDSINNEEEVKDTDVLGNGTLEGATEVLLSLDDEEVDEDENLGATETKTTDFFSGSIDSFNSEGDDDEFGFVDYTEGEEDTSNGSKGKLVLEDDDDDEFSLGGFEGLLRNSKFQK